MSNFTSEFLNFLNSLPNERRKILFGDSNRFKQLFKEYGIDDTDVRFSILIKIF